METPIRILQIVPNMQQGGIENFLMNIYRNIDRRKVQFDFLVHYEKKYYFDDEIEKLGGRIYRLSVREDNNLMKYIKDLNQFFKEHKEYKIVHGHMASLGYFYLHVAKKNGVPIRIAHSHGASYLKNLKGYTKLFLFKFFKIPANIYWACSTEAGKFIFGEKNKFELIPNAIDMKKFKYNTSIRNEVRNDLKLNNKLVIGNVGRFNLQKNHSFLLDIFAELHKINPNTVLLLIGNGELEKNIKEKINKLNLNNDVKLLGIRDDVNRIYQAMDLFLMPSLFEGLPLTGVEAQTSGLRCIFSDTITKEVKISDNAEFFSLKKSSSEWANEIINYSKYSRENYVIKNKDFDINTLAKKIEKKYENYYKKIGE